MKSLARANFADHPELSRGIGRPHRETIAKQELRKYLSNVNHKRHGE